MGFPFGTSGRSPDGLAMMPNAPLPGGRHQSLADELLVTARWAFAPVGD
jgi:hypothetical protein